MIILKYAYLTLVWYLFGLKKAFLSLNINAFVSSSPQDIIDSDLLILPGVGNYGNAVSKINELNIMTAIKTRLDSNKAVLGIVWISAVIFR